MSRPEGSNYGHGGTLALCRCPDCTARRPPPRKGPLTPEQLERWRKRLAAYHAHKAKEREELREALG